MTARLDATLKGSPSERLHAALRPAHIFSREVVTGLTDMTVTQTGEAVNALVAQRIVTEVDGLIALTSAWAALLAEAAHLLGSFHRAQPLIEGMPRDTLRGKLALAPNEFAASLKFAGLQADGTSAQPAIYAEGDWVRLATHKVAFNADQQQRASALLNAMRAQPWATPLVKDCVARLSQPVFDVLVRRRALVVVSADVAFLAETYDHAVKTVRELIRQNGQITAAGVRDAVGTSRKYALALLEHLDAIGVTRRVDDARVLR